MHPQVSHLSVEQLHEKIAIYDAIGRKAKSGKPIRPETEMPGPVPPPPLPTHAIQPLEILFY